MDLALEVDVGLVAGAAEVGGIVDHGRGGGVAEQLTGEDRRERRAAAMGVSSAFSSVREGELEHDAPDVGRERSVRLAWGPARVVAGLEPLADGVVPEAPAHDEDLLAIVVRLPSEGRVVSAPGEEAGEPGCNSPVAGIDAERELLGDSLESGDRRPSSPRPPSRGGSSSGRSSWPSCPPPRTVRRSRRRVLPKLRSFSGESCGRGRQPANTRRTDHRQGHHGERP
jgi:hypothetical protein